MGPFNLASNNLSRARKKKKKKGKKVQFFYTRKLSLRISVH